MKRIASMLSALIVLVALAAVSPAQVPVTPLPPGQIVTQGAPVFEVVSNLSPVVWVDPADPMATLIQGIDGNLYGTTQQGGAYGYGSVFKVTTSGGISVFYSFCSQMLPEDGFNTCLDGSYPSAPLVQDTDGNFYGTTVSGGNGRPDLGGLGTVFKLTLGGRLATLYNFCGGDDGLSPLTGLVQAADGNL